MKKFYIHFAVVLLALFAVACTENNELAIPSTGGSGENQKPIDIPYEELPYFCDLENYEGWSNVRICKDGTAIFTSNELSRSDLTGHEVQKSLMLIPTDELGFILLYGEYDETGFPEILAFNDEMIFIDNYTGETFNATVIVGDTPFWTAEGLELSNQTTRSWVENNWVRNTCAVGGVITSSISIGVGVSLIATGFGTVTGLVTIGAGCDALVGNLEVLFGPGESYMDEDLSQYIQDMGWDKLCDTLTDSESDFLNKWFNKHMGALDKLSWTDLALDLIDQKWGKTVTESQKQLALLLAHRGYVVETGVAKGVTEHTAELWGYITPEALFPLDQYADIEYGIVLYPVSDPAKRMSQYDIVGSAGAFSLLFRGLERDTEYHYFVYYHDKDHMLSRYGETRAFKTEGGEHPYAVDLGLSVKWASCNVGATSPEEYGDYFAWGETSPKSSYTWETYQHWTDYNGDGYWDYDETTPLGDISGTQYDAARANWGGSWRMPTRDNIVELCENCSWEWTAREGVPGMCVTGPNGNSIFLPAAGCCYGTSAGDVGSSGNYWSSTPYEDSDYSAYDLYFDSGDWGYWYGWDNRGLGQSVRPVSE